MFKQGDRLIMKRSKYINPDWYGAIVLFRNQHTNTSILCEVLKVNNKSIEYYIGKELILNSNSLMKLNNHIAYNAKNLPRKE